MRLFIGVPISKKIKKFALDLQRKIIDLKMKINFRLVKPENLHLTLVFLGKVPQEKSDFLFNLINDINHELKSVTIFTKGLSAFPSVQRSRVIFLEFFKENRLNAIVNQIKDRLKKKGVSFDDKPFLPHLSLLRLKKMTRVNLSSLKIPKKELKINKIFVYQSFLSPKGVSYKIINQD